MSGTAPRPCGCGADGDGIGGCSECLGAGELYPAQVAPSRELHPYEED